MTLGVTENKEESSLLPDIRTDARLEEICLLVTEPQSLLARIRLVIQTHMIIKVYQYASSVTFM